MKTATTALLIGALALSACGRIADSRLNPLNWFGRSEVAPAATLEPADGYAALPEDGRLSVTEVTGLEVTRTPGGALVVARGLPPTQGWWDAGLVALNDGVPVEGVLTFAFRVAEPPAPRRVSTPQSRELTAGVFLSDQSLTGVRRIVVQGTANSRAVNR